MVLPQAFRIHEQRLSRDALDAIAFQFDRLALDSSDPKTFFSKFLRISKSPTLPPEDHEVKYLAAKVAYMLAEYQYLNETSEEININFGAKIWHAYAKAAKGQISESIELLEAVEKEVDETVDPMVYIECLGILAQILFSSGSKKKEYLEAVLEKIRHFKVKYSSSLPDFDVMFFPARLTLIRISAREMLTNAVIEETKQLYEHAKELQILFFAQEVLLDLISYNIQIKAFDKLAPLFEEVFVALQTFKFKALQARAICLRGQWEEEQKKFALAEKSYLEAKDAYAKLHDQRGVTYCLELLAFVSEAQQQFTQAEDYFSALLEHANKLSDDYHKIIALTNLAKFFARKGNYAEALEKYQAALSIAQDRGLDVLLTPIFDGLSYVNFIAGNFNAAVETRESALAFKIKYNAPIEELLKDHMKLGQLNAIVGNLTVAFDEFEKALNICMKKNKKDELYFDILNWLFEISTALGKFSLAESYINRADLFASIHASEEENAQALISRIRFHIQKKELVKAESLLDMVFEQVKDFPSALTPALVLIEKTSVILLKCLQQENPSLLDQAQQLLDDMLFISLELEFLPLTMFTKKVLAKILTFKNDFKEALEELTEAIDLAKELAMETFESILQNDLKEIHNIQATFETMTEGELAELKKSFIEESLKFLRETFWLVSASEHQREQFLEQSL